MEIWTPGHQPTGAQSLLDVRSCTGLSGSSSREHRPCRQMNVAEQFPHGGEAVSNGSGQSIVEPLSFARTPESWVFFTGLEILHNHLPGTVGGWTHAVDFT